VPSAQLVDNSGGNLLFLIAFQNTQHLKSFFMMVEGVGDQSMQYGQLREQIKDWGLSHPTLEEVFLI